MTFSHANGYPDRNMSQLVRGNVVRWLFDSRHGPADRLIPRWIFLRTLALWYFSAFYSLLFQIKGLMGPEGVLPAGQYLAAVARALGPRRFWFAPSLFWASSSSRMLMGVMVVGLIASVVAFVNLWPRLSFLVCWVCFLSFVTATSVWSNYQSDGMLLEAGFLSLFFAPRGLMPGWGAHSLPSRASLFLLQWEWFRIYFESGIVKLLSGDQQWRTMTAMDEYYQNGPLADVDRLVRRAPAALVPRGLGPGHAGHGTGHCIHVVLSAPGEDHLLSYRDPVGGWRHPHRQLHFFELPRACRSDSCCWMTGSCAGLCRCDSGRRCRLQLRGRNPKRRSRRYPFLLRVMIRRRRRRSMRAIVPRRACAIGWRSTSARSVSLLSVVMLTWIAYNTTVEMIGMPFGGAPLPTTPISLLDPFRIANQYGLFAVMTRGRYEIEFQGSNDGTNWIAYPFRYKPQALNEAPRIYAPYQPRFEWNLWFASLGDWRQNEFVPLTEERLLTRDADVLGLFRGNPFPNSPPRFVRSVLWQYWFTSIDEKRRTGNWWRRQWVGVYAPELTLNADGRPQVVQWNDELPPHD